LPSGLRGQAVPHLQPLGAGDLQDVARLQAAVVPEALVRVLPDPVGRMQLIRNGFGGRPYRYNYAATNEPGWFAFNGLVKHDTLTGAAERYQFEPGVFCSEVGVAPRVGGPRRTTRIS
jgi:retinal pigment epithelial membrane protein